MKQLFTLEETQLRRAHSVVQVQELLSTHIALEKDHGGENKPGCRVCLNYLGQISDLSIPAEDLPRFRGTLEKSVE